MNKICFLLPNLSAGGAERVTITIARLLCKEGFSVEFINFDSHQGEMLSWIEPEFKMTSFGCSRVLYAIPKLRKFMKEHPDYIYFSSLEHVSIVGLFAAKLERSSIVVRIPNMPKNDLTKGLSGLKLRIIKAINQWVLKFARVIIAQNVEMRTQLLDYYRLPEEKIVVINNPIDKDYVVISAEGCVNPFNIKEINFLNVCNIAYSKGIDILLEAWPKVKASIKDSHLYIVGRNDSAYAKQMMEKAKSLRDITFLGFQYNPYPYLKYCDVFVLPSRMEGFPNVILEAMCFNRPIASTTCVAVVKDIVLEGENGYYCEIENSDAMAECMIKAAQLRDINNDYDLFNKEALLNCFK